MKFKSNFVTDLEVDASNYITELLILNQIEYYKWDKPPFPFWRKEYADKTPKLKRLGANYPLELSDIRNLLAVFGPRIIIEVIQKRKLGTVRFLKKDTKSLLIYDLYMAQVKYIRSIEDLDISKFEDLNQKFEGLPDYKGLRNKSKINL